MTKKSIVIGEYYRHASNPHYGWIKALRVLRPGEGVNCTKYTLVECEWSVDKQVDAAVRFGLITHFRISHLLKPKKWGTK